MPEDFDERYDGCNPLDSVPNNRERCRTVIRRAFVFVVAFLLLIALVQACEAQPAVVSGGVLCDTPEDLKKAIVTKKLTPSCGFLQGEVVAMATVLERFHFEGMSYRIARYIVLSPWSENPIQYGIMGPPTRELSL